MRNTIIIYETHYGTAKKTAETIALIYGNSRAIDINKAPENIDVYKNVVFVFAFHGYETAEKIKIYIQKMSEKLKEKIIAFCGVGLESRDLKNYSKYLCAAMNRNEDFSYFVEGELRVNKLSQEDKKILEEFLKSKNVKLMDMGKFKLDKVCEVAEKLRNDMKTKENNMEEKQLENEIEKFLLEHNTLTLATGYDGFVRATPIEYIYHNKALYFITEGGLKFKGILQNPNVSICVYDNYSNMQNIKGMQIQGTASIIQIGSEEYISIISKKNINMDKINMFPINLNMIRVDIKEIEFLNSDVRKSNFDVKQTLKY